MQTASINYRGRFAPSPTGSLHPGSLLTALASFLQARSRSGQWHLRIDDLDTPRCVPGAADAILRTLERFGLFWDGPVVYQSRMQAAYDEALTQLEREGWIYPCVCSRKSLKGMSAYPGHCRDRPIDRNHPHAFRVKTSACPVTFRDRLQGEQSYSLAAHGGDFVVRRRDRIVAYQLAVVIDDARQHITEVVRGCDLLSSTPRQIHLQQLLGLTTPAYCHLPVLENRAGQKLSKQTGAPSVENTAPGPLLCQLLAWLGHPPPKELRQAPPEDILPWAIAHWQPERLPRRTRITVIS
ncbi:MAG: tRNA glutamyl-Q(34) synthetase GluQRS [Methylohalobius sp. ZOD2]